MKAKIVFDMLAPTGGETNHEGGQRRNTTRDDFTPSSGVRNRPLNIAENLRTDPFRSMLILSVNSQDRYASLGAFFLKGFLIGVVEDFRSFGL
jgi:hypothetical protein